MHAAEDCCWRHDIIVSICLMMHCCSSVTWHQSHDALLLHCCCDMTYDALLLWHMMHCCEHEISRLQASAFPLRMLGMCMVVQTAERGSRGVRPWCHETAFKAGKVRDARSAMLSFYVMTKTSHLLGKQPENFTRS